MNEDLEKVRKRVEKRLEQDARNGNEGAPINDAMDHFQRIEGYPTKNLSKVHMAGLPLPIRILGYLLIGSMGLGAVITIILILVK
ncbi:MAG TPA: hypothetical protein VFT51_08775 [Bacillales bacterium]|nr:hypothetical protein [Bacillales bacterium]